jgi:hypothetical protein
LFKYSGAGAPLKALKAKDLLKAPNMEEGMKTPIKVNWHVLETIMEYCMVNNA